MAVDSDSSFWAGYSPSTSDSALDSADLQLSEVCAAAVTTATTSSAASATTVSTSSMEVRNSSTPSRKRKRCVSEWQKSKRKLLRNSGKEYVTASKNNVSFTCSTST